MVERALTRGAARGDNGATCVFVPATVSASKRAGEPLLVDLEKRGDEIALTAIR